MKKDKSKQIQKSGKKEALIVRSSAAEYLTFVAATGSSETSVEMRYEDENIWLTQKMMATLYDVTVSAVNQHLKRIYSDNELTREATIKKYLIVQTEGDRQVKREVDHYSLQAIIAVASKSKMSVLYSSANGPTRLSRTTPFRGGPWMWNDSSTAAT
jgi:hypothetical protein